jgi:hypothetical protein
MFKFTKELNNIYYLIPTYSKKKYYIRITAVN